MRVVELATAASGTDWSVRARQLQVLQRVDRAALAALGARHHVDQIDVVAHLRNRYAVDHAVERGGDVLRATRRAARALSCSTLTLTTRAGSLQSKVTSPRLRILRHDIGEFAGDLAHAPGCPGPLTRYCTGRPTGGPMSSRWTKASVPGNVLRSQSLVLAAQPVARLQALGEDHRLAEGDIGGLHVEGQHEALRALADIARLMRRCPVSPSSISASNRAICASVSSIEEFCGRFQSTINSGRSDDGKNCCCTNPMPNSGEREGARRVIADRQPAPAHAEIAAWRRTPRANQPLPVS